MGHIGVIWIIILLCSLDEKGCEFVYWADSGWGPVACLFGRGNGPCGVYCPVEELLMFPGKTVAMELFI